MTLFINVRQGAVGGGLHTEAYVIEGASSNGLKTLPRQEVKSRLRGKRILVFCHGFNVSMQAGIRTGVRMEQFLAPADDEAFLALLWPGDFRVPVVNYSFEYADAEKAGRLLAAFLETHASSAPSISLGSHSLGGRVVLETLAASTLRFEEVCMAAPAVDANALSVQFADVLPRVGRMTVLSSESDRTLRWAYPIGDFFSDVFGDDDSAFRGALGFRGPRPSLGAPVHAQPIPRDHGYDHGHYFPGDPASDPVSPTKAKWVRATQYWGRSVRGERGVVW